MKPAIKPLHRAATVALALAALSIAPHRGAPATLVSASQAAEPVIAISFIRPHAPQVLVGEQAALAADANAERIRRGLPALVRDEALDRFAYAKGLEMASRAYFGHTNPDGVTFQDRMRALHWPTQYAAENIAFDRDEPHAHAAFMGVFGMLAVALLVFALRQMSSESHWSSMQKYLRISFWGLNLGLGGMVVLDLFPSGVLQLLDATKHGYWHARSAEFSSQPLIAAMEWARMPADLIFIFLGVVPLVIVTLMTYRHARTEEPATQR